MHIVEGNVAQEPLGPKGIGPEGIGPKGIGPKGIGTEGIGTEQIGPELADIVSRLRRAMRRAARAADPALGLSVAQLELLSCMAEHPGVRPSQLARMLRLAPSSGLGDGGRSRTRWLTRNSRCPVKLQRRLK